MRTVILVPRRDGIPERDATWAWCKARWQAILPEYPIYEGHHTSGPFNRSAAVNTAARLADADGPWDLAVVIDSDILIRRSQVRKAVILAGTSGRVTWAHRRWRGIREDATKRIVDDRRDMGDELDREDLDLIVERTNPISWSCCQVIPRAVFDDMGGFDERFVGWGFEDMAFQSLVVGLYGHERINGDVLHLWHPRSDERIVPGQPALTATPHYITNARLGRRYMVAVRRDHGLHDRPAIADEAEMARDIENLHRDDAKLSAVARRLHLPDWDDWWPTLEELRDGAKALKAGPAPRVTVIVRTGGEPETWSDRFRYLQRSLSSLVENVSGPIVQRRIYSDWGPEHRGELEELGTRYGFKVVGPDRHVGYAQAMQLLWTYIDRNATGDYILSVEDDFIYERPVDLLPMIATLEEHPELRQLALLRGPVFPRELEAGGVLPTMKHEPVLRNHRPFPYLEHRDHFTANPSLFHRRLVQMPWPGGENTERRFGDSVLRDASARFAYWGAGEPWIAHIGEVRAANAY
jgi:hypothetical protein